MNKWGLLSILTVVASILVFFIIRGPQANLMMAIIILGSLSIVGIIFALLSRKWLFGVIGVLLNGIVMIFVYLLVLANGISEV
ncbi:hypothetical protein FZW96_00345 [Bacillus sp. BGMRC 2118]|nr:hypothetical protein FZW96_00345 [Bacillus sp. BGMRC 2118]